MTISACPPRRLNASAAASGRKSGPGGGRAGADLLDRLRDVRRVSSDADEHTVGDAAGHFQRPRAAGRDPDRHRTVVRQARRLARTDVEAWPSSSARIKRVLAARGRVRAATRPAARRCRPRPSRSVRPGASSSTVAIDDAVTVGCRFTGFDRSVARMMRSVTRAAAAIRTYVSRRRSCESGWNAASQPRASARRTSAAKASTERASSRSGSVIVSSRRASCPSRRSPCRGRRRRGRSRAA